MTDDQQLRIHCVTMLGSSFDGRLLLEEAKKLYDFILTVEIPPADEPQATVEKVTPEESGSAS